MCERSDNFNYLWPQTNINHIMVSAAFTRDCTIAALEREYFIFSRENVRKCLIVFPSAFCWRKQKLFNTPD